MIPDDEKARCAITGLRHGIDWRLLIALRETENGRPGLEFGVEDPAADTFDKQADEAARTIRHTIGRFARNVTPGEWWDEVRGRYVADFLHYFSRGGLGYQGYAPIGATNDPTNLNKNHFGNLVQHYGEQCPP